jgi:GNAT superfamily N-acetyltransferase
VRASSRPTFPAGIRSRRTVCAATLTFMRVDVVALQERPAYGIVRAAWLSDTPDIPPPSEDSFRRQIRYPQPGYDCEFALALLDGTPTGYLLLGFPVHDNLDNAVTEIVVHPAYRRRSVGRALHAHAVRRLRARGRKRLTGETVQGRSPGDAFAASVGAGAALTETRSRLDVTGLDQGRLDTMLARAWAHADGYRAVTWVGMPPDGWLDDVAYLDGRLLADSPTGDLDWEPERVDAARARAGEQNRLDRGHDRFHAGAVHQASGRLVGWTVLGGPRDTPEHLWQNITLVDPPHRGHRLGTIIKLENLRHAREHRPALRMIDTSNASSNRHMLAINAAMGFRAVDSWTLWQQTV